MITFSCECGKRYQVKDELAGKRANCSCGKTLIIPHPAASSTELKAKPTATHSPAPPSASVDKGAKSQGAVFDRAETPTLATDCTGEGSDAHLAALVRQNKQSSQRSYRKVSMAFWHAFVWLFCLAIVLSVSAFYVGVRFDKATQVDETLFDSSGLLMNREGTAVAVKLAGDKQLRQVATEWRAELRVARILGVCATLVAACSIAIGVYLVLVANSARSTKVVTCVAVGIMGLIIGIFGYANHQVGNRIAADCEIVKVGTIMSPIHS